MPGTYLKPLLAVAAILAIGFAAFSFTSSTAAAVAPVSTTQDEDALSSLTLKEIESVTGVPKDYMVKYLNLPACAAGDRNKLVGEMLAKHGLTVVDLREAVARYRAGFRL